MRELRTIPAASKHGKEARHASLVATKVKLNLKLKWYFFLSCIAFQCALLKQPFPWCDLREGLRQMKACCLSKSINLLANII